MEMEKVWFTLHLERERERHKVPAADVGEEEEDRNKIRNNCIKGGRSGHS